MKLLGGTKRKITKSKTRENVPYLKVNEVALVHCNIVNKNYQIISKNPIIICSL